MLKKHFAVPLLLALLAATCSCAFAQDASLLAGRLYNDKVHEHSFAVEVGYAERLGRYGSLGVEYYNEGHPSQHHRDGLTSQLWLHTPIPEKGASFGVGFGPYYYFDTTTGLGSASDYRNLHGWGTLASLSAKWHLEKRSYVELRFNHVRTHGDGDSNSILLGMGYELKNVPDRVGDLTEKKGDRMVTVAGGQAIVNSFESERAFAYAVEYRDAVTQNVQWSAMLLNEGQVGLVERKGIVGRLWFVRSFTENTVLEVGGGGYWMHDRDNPNDPLEESRSRLVPIVSLGMRYRINPDWRAEFTWSRVITNYHRDSDVLLFGFGRVF
jgi:hypothetical protein